MMVNLSEVGLRTKSKNGLILRGLPGDSEAGGGNFNPKIYRNYQFY
jgi:hypothetical protein